MISGDKKVFLTGATGFVGCYLLHRLLVDGYHVRALHRSESDLTFARAIFEQQNEWSNEQADWHTIEWVEGDLLDTQTLYELTSGVDIVIHAAAMVSFHKEDVHQMMQVNVEGTANLVNACIENNIKQISHISSVASLANPDKSELLDESFQTDTFMKFNTRYSESKYRAEMEIWRAYGEGINVQVFNPGLVLGAWKYENSSIQMVRSVFYGLPFYSKGLTGFVDVRDIANAVVNSLNKKDLLGKRYILISENKSYRYLLEEIAKRLKAKTPRIGVGQRPSILFARFEQLRSFLTGKRPFITKEVARSANRRTSFSNERIRSELGFQFRPIEETLDWMCAHFLRQINL